MYKVINIFSGIQQVNDTDFCSLFFKLFADTFSDTSRATRDYATLFSNMRSILSLHLVFAYSAFGIIKRFIFVDMPGRGGVYVRCRCDSVR